MVNIFLISLSLLLIISCGQRNDIGNSSGIKTIAKEDTDQIKHIASVMETGPSLFKTNCAICHCPPTANCEPSGRPHLKQVFDTLPGIQIDYFVSFVKDSKKLKESRDSYYVALESSTSVNLEHSFSKTLKDSTIKTIVEYIWLSSQATPTK